MLARRPSRLLALAAGLGLILAARSTSAQDAPPPAPDAASVERGIALRQEGRDAEAREEFARAYEATGEPRALAQLALAEQALGRWVDARAHLADALERGDDPWIVEHRETLEGALAVILTHVGQIEVTAEPDDAELAIDGEVCPPGAPRWVPAGEVVVQARAEGHVPLQRTDVVVAGGLTRVHLRLSRALPVAPPAEVPPAGAPAPRVSVDLTGLHVATVTVASLAGGALIAFGVALGVREGRAVGYNDCVLVAGSPLPCQDRLGPFHDAASAALGLGIGAALAGAAALTLGLVSLLLDSPSEEAVR